MVFNVAALALEILFPFYLTRKNIGLGLGALFDSPVLSPQGYHIVASVVLIMPSLPTFGRYQSVLPVLNRYHTGRNSHIDSSGVVEYQYQPPSESEKILSGKLSSFP